MSTATIGGVCATIVYCEAEASSPLKVAVRARNVEMEAAMQ